MTVRVVWLVLALAAAGVGYWYFYDLLPPGARPWAIGNRAGEAVSASTGADASGRKSGAATAGGGPARVIRVEAQPVETATIERTLTAVGTLESNESIVLRPEIAGRIAAIHFAEGERVLQGALLVELDASSLRAELAEAEARLALARRTAARVRDLYARQVASASDRDDAVSQYEIAEASINLATVRLAKTRMYAPFEGVLGLRNVSIGAYVNPGDDLVTLDDIDPIKVDFRVPEPALSLVKTGQNVQVRVDAFPDQTFSGAVYAIAPRVDVDGRTVSLRARLDNPQGVLRPGLFARVDLVVERHENAMVIPEQAVVPLSDRQAVYRVIDGQAWLTSVTLGYRRAAQVEIKQGLSVGDLVVTAGQLKLRDGAQVTVAGSDEGGAVKPAAASAEKPQVRNKTAAGESDRAGGTTRDPVKQSGAEPAAAKGS